jgi:hypothetical protein
VIAHGNGYAHTAYTYLAQHLARNGFAVVSVHTGDLQSASDRADAIITYIDGMLNFYAGAHNLSSHISLIGHSRGGEGVVAAAIRSRQQGRPWTIRSVITLAPTDVGNPSDLNLTFDASRSMMAIVASRDGDVVGRCVGDHSNCSANFPLQQPSTGFSLYDRAGGWSLSSAPEPRHWMNKAFVFLHGATHRCFSDHPFGFNQGPGTLGCSAQRDVTRGYVTAFLRWQVKGEGEYRPFFTGDSELPAVASNGVAIRQQFHAFAPRVLDDFENGQWWNNTLGGSVSEFNLTLDNFTSFQIDSFVPVAGLHYGVPHDGQALLVHWSTTPLVPKVLHTDVPFARRNVSGWGFFSLRAAKLYASTLNSAGTMSIRVSMTDLDGGTAFVNLVDYGGLRDAEEFHLVTSEGTVGVVGGNYSKTAFETFRIPLSHFAGVDFSRLDRVSLAFPGGSGEVILDDLTFTN